MCSERKPFVYFHKLSMHYLALHSFEVRWAGEKRVARGGVRERRACFGLAGQGEGRRLAHHEQLGDERGEEGRARGPLWRAPVGWSRLQFWLLRAQAGPERWAGTVMKGFLDCHMRATSISSTSTSNSTFFACWQPDKERGRMVLRKTRRMWTGQAVLRPPRTFRWCPSRSAYSRKSPRTSNRPHNGLKLPAPGRERSI